MPVDLTLPILTGFLASFHCVGMCGPVVTGFVVQKPIAIDLPGSAGMTLIRSIAPQVYYNLGRVLSYGMIGLLAGAVGSVGLLNPALLQATAIFFGVVMILMGLFQLDKIKLLKRKSKGKGTIQKVFQGLSSTTRMESKLLVGLLTPLLPCGLLYAMAAQAASLGSPLIGSLTMGAFALGAIPALVVTGMAASLLSGKLRKIGTNLAAILIIIMGVLTVARGFGFNTHFLPTGPATEHLCGQP